MFMQKSLPSTINSITIANTDNAIDSSDTSTYTFSTKNTGAGLEGKIVLVSVNAIVTGAADISSVTLGGTAMIELAKQVVTPANRGVSAIYGLRVSNMATATIVVNTAATGFRCGIGVFTMHGSDQLLPRFTAGATTNGGAMSITVPAGGAVLGTGGCNDLSTGTWSNLTEAYEHQGEGTMGGAANSALGHWNTFSATITWAGGGPTIFTSVTASWGNS